MKTLGTLAELFEDAYADPSPYDSIENFARARHEDIASMDDTALDRERIQARLRWAFSLAPSSWLLERVARLDREAVRRRRR